MDGIPWQLLPVIGPSAFSFGVIVTVILALYRSFEGSRLQTARQVEIQLEAKDNVIALQRETIEHHRATHEDLMESARLTAETLQAIRSTVERWE